MASKTIILLLFLFSVAFSQINDLSHFTGGGFNRAVLRDIQDFASWDTTNQRYNNIPKATFDGAVSDIAAAGNGFLVVGSFTTLNGLPAGGIAYFDGNRWCTMPHLNLYRYQRTIPTPTRFPLPTAGFAPGSAAAIYATGNTYYVFGGLDNGAPRFNQVGTLRTGVDGLVRLTFANSNFTADSLNYFAPGRFANGSFETTTNGFPAISGAPTTVLGRTKLRVINAGGVLSFYVHPNLGNNAHILRWRQNDGSWLAITNNGTTAFNVNSVGTTFNVLAPAIPGALDFDADVAANVLFIAGSFDNTRDSNNPAQRYLHVASTNNANTASISWQVAANWQNPSNFNQTGQRASAIAVNNQNQFYVAIPFNNQDTNDNLFGQNIFNIYVINSGAPSTVGSNFASAAGTDPNFVRLSFYRSTIYAFGGFSLYNRIFDQSNTWVRRYTRKVSGAVRFDSAANDWVDAYGGFTPLSTNGNVIPGVAAGSGSVDFLWYAGATQVYDIYSSGGLVAYNTKTRRWVNSARQRFTVSDGANGGDGGVATVHFLKRQRRSVTDAVVIGGNFDWFGTQYLGSIAYLRTNDNSLQQIGGGVYTDETSPSFTGDQVTPVYRAGVVLDIEERGDSLYVGGRFSKNINGACLSNIARSNNDATFEPLASGCDGTVFDLLFVGSSLYVGGSFTTCSGVPGTRRIAMWDTNRNEFKALGSGFPNGRVYAMISFGGQLYVGGDFTTAPAGYRSATSVTGLYRWNGKAWSPVIARCQIDCGINEFTFPFVDADPLARSVSTVRSLRSLGSRLYVQANVKATGTSYLLQYDGLWRQLGVAQGNTGCIKQGCLASNFSNIIASGFSLSDNFNQNYQQYEFDKQNWVQTYNGYDAAPTFTASASFFSASMLVACVITFVFLF